MFPGRAEVDPDRLCDARARRQGEAGQPPHRRPHRHKVVEERCVL